MYVDASFIILEGVFIRAKRGFAEITLMKVTIIVAIIDKVIELATAFFTPASSLAPYFWEISTANPLVSPITNPFTKNTMELVVPTAANASTPTNLPTIIVSTIL